MSIIITGGKGDLAKALVHVFSDQYQVLAPGRNELDVTSQHSIDTFFASVDEAQLLICNAGACFDSLLLKMAESDWDKALDVNLKGAFLCTKAVARKMVKAKCGHIVFISSYSAFNPPIGQVNYAAAKSGLIGFAKSLAAELGAKNIRVNVIVPGWLETQMTASTSSGRHHEVKEKHALGTFNTPEAVAAFVKTLHDAMPYTSGQVFHLDSRILA